ncbi:exo-alpha-sialidase, partial [bacterium]|nr:exo-alpha-sialidase [bacterium]
DVYGQVHYTRTEDLGENWSAPKPIPAFARHAIDGGLEMGVCDVVPAYHAQTGLVLAIGHNVYYKNDKLTRPSKQRYPMYAVYDPKKKTWSRRRRLEWDDPRATAMYTCGCGQRWILANGDILIPFSYAPLGRTDRAVGTVLCSFDGERVRIQESGPEMRLQVKRGLLEPSLTKFGGRYYMTIRAEDGHGYVSVSTDGLHWQPLRPWQWKNGEALTMSTTQQHWIRHRKGLFLVYTRKADHNMNVFRWRAPLYMARVDIDSLSLRKATEQVVLPLVGDGVKDAKHVARMGNFHTTNITPQESWVTVGETLPADAWKGHTLLARIRWERPNRL